MNTLRIMVVQVTRKHDFGYSLKNIPIPSKKEYLKELTHSVEKFVRNLRWRAHFFLNPNDKPSKECYGFTSIRAPPQIMELKQFEDRLFTLIRNIEFRPYTNTFQDKLRRDIKDIEDSNYVFVAADKIGLTQTSKSSLSYVLCCNLVNISRRMESKVSFRIKILWAIQWL